MEEINASKKRILYFIPTFPVLTETFIAREVIKVIEKGLEKKRAKDSLKLEREKIWNRAQNLEEQINRARQNLIMSYEGTVKALILTIDAKDHYTFNHSEHVARLSSAIAGELDISKDARDKLEQAALMHDIGKIGVNELILRKVLCQY